MPSIIPGYEYDIFISYRQKDNRSDQWVTKFVQALNAYIPELTEGGKLLEGSLEMLLLDQERIQTENN